MNYSDSEEKLSKVLTAYAESLDISESRFKEAEDRYTAVSNWLCRNESTLRLRNPEIYAQGSFRLGTVVKPINNKEEYDVDVVCQLNYNSTEISQAELKKALGNELKLYAKANNMKNEPEKSKRCWILQYADGAQFHMDVLPSIPDSDDGFRKMLLENKVPESIAAMALRITDKSQPDYDKVGAIWLKSNPKGYAEWFKNRMRVRFTEDSRMLLERKVYASVEDVPLYKVKTTLQRAIQILKRHRDIRFEKNPDVKPISIIISTLAGHAYNNESNLYVALKGIIDRMSQYLFQKDGIAWIPNPVNPTENFADKWPKHPERKIAFEQWLVAVRNDMFAALKKDRDLDMAQVLGASLGTGLYEDVSKRLQPATPSVTVQTKNYPKVQLRDDKDVRPWKGI